MSKAEKRFIVQQRGKAEWCAVDTDTWTVVFTGSEAAAKAVAKGRNAEAEAAK